MESGFLCRHTLRIRRIATYQARVRPTMRLAVGRNDAMAEGLSSALGRLSGAEGDLQEARLRLEMAQASGGAHVGPWRGFAGRSRRLEPGF
jgi:hypothetical protein